MPRTLALIIGIDVYPFFDKNAQLAGAVRDACAMAELLTSRFGLADEDVRRCFDAEASRQGILDSMEWLWRRLQPGDEALFYYSGHGSQMTDREQDEDDGLDETLVPFDSARFEALFGSDVNRDITDDEIQRWSAAVLERAGHLTMIFDCCHSATLHRPDWQSRCVPPDLRPVHQLPPSPLATRPPWQQRDISMDAKPLVLAACEDDERALEMPASVVGEPRGAFSFYLTETLRQADSSATWRDIFLATVDAVGEVSPEQHPRLSGDGMGRRPLTGSPRQADRKPSGSALKAWIESRPADPPVPALEVTFYRLRSGPWIPMDPSPWLPFRHQDRLRIDVLNPQDEAVYLYWFDLGHHGDLRLLFPDHGGHIVLQSGICLRLGDRDEDAMSLEWPENRLEERDTWMGHLLLVASPSALSTSQLMATDIDFGELQDVTGVAYPYRLQGSGSTPSN